MGVQDRRLLTLGCGVVDYNARPRGGGLIGLGELDVIGFDYSGRKFTFAKSLRT